VQRRKFVTAIGTMTLIAGCTGTTDENGSSDEESESGSSTNEGTESDTSATTEQVIIDETIFSQERIPVELSAGGTLSISINLQRGTVCVVDVANRTEGESIFSETVQTEDEFEISIEDDGEYLITFQGHDEADVRAVVT